MIVVEVEWPARYMGEVLDYYIEWAGKLQVGETIVGEPVTTMTAGLVKDSQSTTGTKTTYQISGGTRPNAFAKVFALATTSAGRKIGAKVLLPILAA